MRFTGPVIPPTVMSPVLVAISSRRLRGTSRSQRTWQSATGMGQLPSRTLKVAPSIRSSTNGRRSP